MNMHQYIQSAAADISGAKRADGVETITDAVAVCLLSKGFTVKFPYSEQYGVHCTLSLNGEVVWEGDGGEAGAAYAQRVLDCAHHLKVLRQHVPEGVFKSGLEAAQALLLLSGMNEYLPEEDEE